MVFVPEEVTSPTKRLNPWGVKLKLVIEIFWVALDIQPLEFV